MGSDELLDKCVALWDNGTDIVNACASLTDFLLRGPFINYPDKSAAFEFFANTVVPKILSVFPQLFQNTAGDDSNNSNEPNGEEIDGNESLEKVQIVVAWLSEISVLENIPRLLINATREYYLSDHFENRLCAATLIGICIQESPRDETLMRCLFKLMQDTSQKVKLTAWITFIERNLWISKDFKKKTVKLLADYAFSDLESYETSIYAQVLRRNAYTASENTIRKILRSVVDHLPRVPSFSQNENSNLIKIFSGIGRAIDLESETTLRLFNELLQITTNLLSQNPEQKTVRCLCVFLVEYFTFGKELKLSAAQISSLWEQLMKLYSDPVTKTIVILSVLRLLTKYETCTPQQVEEFKALPLEFSVSELNSLESVDFDAYIECALYKDPNFIKTLIRDIYPNVEPNSTCQIIQTLDSKEQMKHCDYGLCKEFVLVLLSDANKAELQEQEFYSSWFQSACKFINNRFVVQAEVEHLYEILVPLFSLATDKILDLDSDNTFITLVGSILEKIPDVILPVLYNGVILPLLAKHDYVELFEDAGLPYEEITSPEPVYTLEAFLEDSPFTEEDSGPVLISLPSEFTETDEIIEHLEQEEGPISFRLSTSKIADVNNLVAIMSENFSVVRKVALDLKIEGVLDETVVASLAAVIPKLDHLRELILEVCPGGSLSSETFSVLADGLAQNRSIHVLHLNGNGSEKDYQEFFSVLESNPLISEVKVKDCRFACDFNLPVSHIKRILASMREKNAPKKA